MTDLEVAARRFVADVWNGGREESAYELIAEGCPGLGGTGPAATLAWHRDRRAAFPDLRYKIVDLVASADRVAVRWRAAGTRPGSSGRCRRPVRWRAGRGRRSCGSTPTG